MVRFALLGMVLLAACLPTTPPACAQGTEAFDWVEIRMAGAQNVNRNFLHEFWTPDPGGEFSVATPFYFGYAEFGGAYHRYRMDHADVPDFDAVLVYAGWGLDLEVARRLRLEAGLRAGNYRMSFDDKDIPFAGVRHESELALLVNARVALRPVGPVWLYVGGSYMKVFTFLRLNLWYASAGLSMRLHSPDWLKDFLR
jgi:hypothetical protein